MLSELFASAPLVAIFSVRFRSSKIVLNLNTVLLRYYQTLCSLDVLELYVSPFLERLSE